MWGQLIGTRLALACLLASAVLASACAGDNGGGTSGASGEKARVYYLLPTLEDQAYLDNMAGAKAGAKNFTDVAFRFDAGNSREGAADMVRRVESAVTKQYDVIALLPGAVANEITPALRKATQAGIKIVSAGAGGTPVEQLAEANIELDYVANGKLMGEFAKEQIGSGEAGIIDCFTEVPQTKAINDGIRAALDGSDLSIVAHLDSKCDPAKSRSAAENMLTAHGDIEVIFTIWDISALGAMKAVEGTDAILVGGGGQKDAVKMIAEDNTSLKASTNAHFYETGERLAQTAAMVANGKQPSAEIRIEPSLITEENAAKVLAQAGERRTVG
jgi:ABC-type sugar transport system substrate-binding protein